MTTIETNNDKLAAPTETTNAVGFVARSTIGVQSVHCKICSRSCLELNCDNVGIKYGKFCGVGHTGCAGEKPCDDLDACCQVRDDCVGRRGSRVHGWRTSSSSFYSGIFSVHLTLIGLTQPFFFLMVFGISCIVL